MSPTFPIGPAVAVVGLGCGGLSLAVAFGQRFRTVFFDLSHEKVDPYRRFVDPPDEVSSGELKIFALLRYPDGACAAMVPRWAEAVLAGEPFLINHDAQTSRDFCIPDGLDATADWHAGCH